MINESNKDLLRTADTTERLQSLPYVLKALAATGPKWNPHTKTYLLPTCMIYQLYKGGYRNSLPSFHRQ